MLVLSTFLCYEPISASPATEYNTDADPKHIYLGSVYRLTTLFKRGYHTKSLKKNKFEMSLPEALGLVFSFIKQCKFTMSLHQKFRCFFIAGLHGKF